MFRRSWVQIPVPYTGRGCFLCASLVYCNFAAALSLNKGKCPSGQEQCDQIGQFIGLWTTF